MSTEILNLGTVGILFFLFMKEFFVYLKSKKNTGYKVELEGINNKLGNHLHDVNNHISRIETRLNGMETDIKIIKDCINDIKIAIK